MKIKKDFIKNLILKKLIIMPSEEIAKEYGISLYVIKYFEETVRTGKPYGHILTEHDVLDLYLEGLTQREIGYLKGITKEGVRYVLDRMVIDKEQIKKEHRRRRKELWENIQAKIVEEEIERNGIKGAAYNLGYSERYLRRVYRRIKG